MGNPHYVKQLALVYTMNVLYNWTQDPLYYILLSLLRYFRTLAKMKNIMVC